MNITLQRLKNAVQDIKSEWYEGNDSHSTAEYRGACESLDMLIKHFQETLEKMRGKPDWVWVYGDECDFIWKHFNMSARGDFDRLKLQFIDYEEGQNG